MPGTRLVLDLYYEGKTPAQLNAEFPNLLPAIKSLKNKATKINAGLPNEEFTIKAIYHICRNDINQPCGGDIEI